MMLTEKDRKEEFCLFLKNYGDRKDGTGRGVICDEEYFYGGDDLGAVCSEEGTAFKVWSPEAGAVILRLFRDGGDGRHFSSIALERGERGCWWYRTDECLHGVYYDYEIFVHGKWNRTADPYARACGVNGLRSMVVDLRRTDPEGWERDLPLKTQTESVIYELHVKEFSWDESAGFPSECRGKYTAFSVDDTTLFGDGIHPTGMGYLRELGVTHVQLMPVYDFGSVDEAGAEDLFNWGYDPVNYNVPEGSYSSDPFHGEVRIRELKEAVQALHRNGFRVIMDVVYNHTYSADSWFERTVPGYYYRRNPDGTLSNGSCCGNDFASERLMAAEYIVQSVLYWAKEYHMDGFRFDLMGLLDTKLMNRIQQELDDAFGPGEKLIYGEPWAGSDTAMEMGFVQALKENERLLSPRIGMFCDNTRDAIKGHVFEAEEPGFVNGGTGLEEEILHSVSAWCDGSEALNPGSPERILSYVSAHDNFTLWDKLILSMSREKDFYVREEAVMKAYRLAAAIYFTCQGRIFFLSGEEFARTKEGIGDSYCSPIEINRLDYKRAYEFEDLVTYYKGLIALRKCLPGLCDKSDQAGKRIGRKRIEAEGVVSFCVNNRERKNPGERQEKNGAMTDKWETLLVGYNSTGQSVEIELPPGKWRWLLRDDDSNLWRNDCQVVQKKIVLAPVSAGILGSVRDESL